MRFMFAVKLMIIGLFFVYAATTVAPQMTWPVTPSDWIAVRLMVAGCVALLLGAYLLVTDGTDARHRR